MIIDDYLGESVVKAAHHVHEAGETLNRLYNLQVTSNLSELIAMLTNEHGKVPTGGVTMYMSCIWKDGMKSFLFSFDEAHRHTDPSVFVHTGNHRQLEEMAWKSHHDLSGREVRI